MAFLHSQSCECLKSELLLFEIPPTQTTIEGSHRVQYKPISSFTDDSPIEFIIPGNGDEYLDFPHTMLSLKVSLKCILPEEKLKATPVEVLEKAGPINNFMHSLFNQESKL